MPRLEIQVTLEDQSKPLILRLGATNPTEAVTMPRWRTLPIYLVSGSQTSWTRHCMALRDKTVLAFTPAEVQEVQSCVHDVPVVVQRQAEDTWSLTAPVRAKADDQQVRAMIQRLHDVKVQAFIAEDVTDLNPMACRRRPGMSVEHRSGPYAADAQPGQGRQRTERRLCQTRRCGARVSPTPGVVGQSAQNRHGPA